MKTPDMSDHYLMTALVFGHEYEFLATLDNCTTFSK
jgi:hypothetical protein